MNIERDERESDGVRFWVVSDPPEDDAPKFSPCFGVCDEVAGGIIAYFNDEDQAQTFAETCIQRNTIRVKIRQDEVFSDQYQEGIWDYGTLVCWHRRSNLGKVNYPEHEDFLSRVSERALKIPIYCYEHSDIALSTTPLSCPWDSGQMGVWVFEPEDIEEIYGEYSDSSLERVREGVSSMIKHLNDLLSGNVWHITIEDGHGETIDSCGGFVGSDEDCLENIKSHFSGEYHTLIEKAWEERC